MPYDEQLAQRVRKIIKRRKGITERKMFGGLAFMLNGNMCCGVLDDKIVLRLGNDGAAEALRVKHIEPMDFTGRPMKSMVYVTAPGIRKDPDLKSWIARAAKFNAALPPK